MSINAGLMYYAKKQHDEFVMIADCDTPKDILEIAMFEEFMPSLGSPTLLDHLGEAVKDQQMGSINIHINLSKAIHGEGLLVSKEEARTKVTNWFNDNQENIETMSEKELGTKFMYFMTNEIIG